MLESSISDEQVQPAAYDTCFALTRDLLVRQRRLMTLDTPFVYPVVLERAVRVCDEARAILIPVLCSADRDVRNRRVATRPAMRSQPAGQSRTPGYARERFSHLPVDRIEIVTDGAIDDAILKAVGAIRRRLALPNTLAHQ